MTNYRDPGYIRAHLKSILRFYDGRVIDPDGGFFQNFYDDGAVFRPRHRHLVSSTRMVFNYCKAYALTGDAQHREYAAHGFQFLRGVHWDRQRESFGWILDGRDVVDGTNHCYGLAFVILAAAAALEAELEGAHEVLEAAEALLHTRLWDESAKLYADEASPDWAIVSDYRGQNSNMHVTEAFIAAYECTGERHYLDNAFGLARRVTIDLAARSDGLIWEHYTKDLEVDWDYNKDDPRNIYRPWGFQPGHHTEWAKLLLILNSHRADAWMPQRAQQLVDCAFRYGWDDEYGGLYYGFAPDKTICDADKYFWVQSETLATLVRLAIATGDEHYWTLYDQLWAYADEHFVDHQHGAWFRILQRNNAKYTDQKSIAGAKCDYHTIGACVDILGSLPADRKCGPASARIR